MQKLLHRVALATSHDQIRLFQLVVHVERSRLGIGAHSNNTVWIFKQFRNKVWRIESKFTQTGDKSLGIDTISRDPNVHICCSAGVAVNRNSEAPN